MSSKKCPLPDRRAAVILAAIITMKSWDDMRIRPSKRVYISRVFHDRIQFAGALQSAAVLLAE